MGANRIAQVGARMRWPQLAEQRDARRDSRELSLLLVAAAFVILNAVAYSLVNTGALSWQHLWPAGVWLAIVTVAHFALRYLAPGRDPYLLPLFALLAGWGLLLIDRLAPNFLARQVIWLLIASTAALGVALFPRPLVQLQQYRYTLLAGGLLLLGLTLLFGVNPSGGGARLWLPLPVPFVGPIYFQPSELLKLVMIVFFASYFTEREPQFHHGARGERLNWRRRLTRQLPFLGPLLFVWGFSIVLLVWQRDLGAATLFFLLFLALLYLATGRLAYVFGGLALFGVAAAGAYVLFSDLVAPRFTAWVNPWPDASDSAYQIVQSLYALAAGGITGQGIGQGFPGYIPVVHSDFAFAAIGEEWGLVGSLVVVLCFAMLAQRALRIALDFSSGPGPQHFYAYLAAGVAVLFSTQALLIMGGVTKLLPLTGITLPFVSYGGSSLLISAIMLGLLLYLSAAAQAD